MARNKFFKIRVDAAEREALQVASDASGFKHVSEFIRSIVLDVAQGQSGPHLDRSEQSQPAHRAT